MRLSFRAYLIRLLVFTAIVSLLTALAWLIAPAEYLSPTLPAFPFFFFLITLLIHQSLIGKVGSGSRFIQQYMIVTIGKLLLFMTILLIYAFTRTADALAFSIAFLMYYLLYSGFEVIHLLMANRNQE